jgi:hypothetical protein
MVKKKTIGFMMLILSIILIASSSTKLTGFSILKNYSYSSITSLIGILLLFASLILLISGKSQIPLEERVKRIVFNAGTWDKESIKRGIINVKGYLYVAPVKEGTYLGLKTPKLGQEEVLLEIKYANPYLFVDDRSPLGKINQEAMWVGRNLKLRKVSEKLVKEHGIPYRHIIVEPTDSNERSLTKEEYTDARKTFEESFGKSARPDYMNKKEWKTFIDIIESIKKKNPSKISARGKK